MKLSDNSEVQQLLKVRITAKSHLYAVENAGQLNGFSIAFNGTHESGDARLAAAAALVPYYQGCLERIETRLKTLGVEVDQDY